MAKRPNFRTVNDVSASTSQALDQFQGKRFQPLLSLNDRLKRHPMIFWSIIWISIAWPSAFAIGSLINPNSVEPQTVTAIAQNSDLEVAKPLPNSSPDSGQLPLWVFGAIAVGCTASCFMLASYIKPIEIQTAEADLEEPIAANQPTLAKRSQHPINSSKQPLKRLKPYESTEALPFMQTGRSQPIQPLAVEWVTSTQHLNSSYSTDHIAEPVLVTVIPAEEPQPLDWGEARLADAMDLRRRHPLHFAAKSDSQS